MNKEQKKTLKNMMLFFAIYPLIVVIFVALSGITPDPPPDS